MSFLGRGRVKALVAEMNLLRMVGGGSLFHRHRCCLVFFRTEKIEGMKPGMACHFNFCEATLGF